MDLTIVLALITVALFSRVVISQRRESSREMSRFRGEEVDLFKEISGSLNAAAASIAEKKGGKHSLSQHLKHNKEGLARQLKEAGLETAELQGKYMLVRIGMGVVCPAVGAAVGFTYMIPYYATLFTIFMTAAGLGAPILWLKSRTQSRSEDIQRELPLVLDLTNLGTSAGWDVSSALERVIDALYPEFPNHPLIRELKKARWSIPNGYTWEEALKRASDQLNDDTVRRSTLALAQAIRQGGDRTTQLEGIAQDAQRIYYTALDKRLAGMPVKALLVTMMLMVSYFMILMAPAAVQIKDVVVKANQKKVETLKR